MGLRAERRPSREPFVEQDAGGVDIRAHVALVADLIRDCSRRNRIVLDPFGGSGTTILAAERTGRIARVIELDPLYVDLAVRRCEQTAGTAPRHAELGLNLTDLAAQRATAEASSEPRYPEVITSEEN